MIARMRDSQSKKKRERRCKRSCNSEQEWLSGNPNLEFQFYFLQCERKLKCGNRKDGDPIHKTKNINEVKTQKGQ